MIKIWVQLVIWTQPSGPLCLWQCLKIISHLKIFVPVSNINNRRQIYYSFETCSFSKVLHQQKLKILKFTQEKSKNCNIIWSKFRIFTSLSQCLNILANITLALLVVLVTNCWSVFSSNTRAPEDYSARASRLQDHQENNLRYGPHNKLIWEKDLAVVKSFSHISKKNIWRRISRKKLCLRTWWITAGGRFCTHYISYKEALRQSYNYISYEETLRQNPI